MTSLYINIHTYNTYTTPLSQLTTLYFSFPLAFYSILNCHGIFYRNSPTTSTFTFNLSRLPWYSRSILLHRSPHTFVVRPIIVAMILRPLLYSQLPWHISLSDLHCHGILYRDSPTTTIIFTLISNLFSTAMAYSLVTYFITLCLFTCTNLFALSNSTAMAHFFFLTSTVMAYSTAIQLYMLR